MQHTSVASVRNVVGVIYPVLICILGFNHKLRHEYYCDYNVSESNAKSKRESKTMPKFLAIFGQVTHGEYTIFIALVSIQK